jgi:hypothetical protein
MENPSIEVVEKKRKRLGLWRSVGFETVSVRIDRCLYNQGRYGWRGRGGSTPGFGFDRLE